MGSDLDWLIGFIGKYYFDSDQHIESNATARFNLAYHHKKLWGKWGLENGGNEGGNGEMEMGTNLNYVDYVRMGSNLDCL